MRFSASRIERWMECPLQAHFHYDMKLPSSQNAKATFGTIIHHCLEKYHKGYSIDEVIAIFVSLWSEPEKLRPNLNPDYWPKYTTYISLKAKGIEILKGYHEKAKWEHREIVAVEHPFLVPFGDHELQGYVDFVEIKKAGNGRRTLRVIDLKTAGRAPTKPQLRLNTQFTVYMFASEQPEFYFGNGPKFPPLNDADRLWDEVKDMPRKAIWHHLMTNKEIDAGPRDDGDYMRLYRVCKEIARANELQVHVPRIGEACIYCDYNEPCGVPIPTEEELEVVI